MPNTIYYAAQATLLAGGLNLLTDTLKVLLLDETYTPDPASHETLDDINGEVSGAGYTSGGQSLTGRDILRDDLSGRAALHAENPTWPAADFSARAALLYRLGANPADSPLLAYYDFGRLITPDGGDVTLEWHADGVLLLENQA